MRFTEKTEFAFIEEEPLKYAPKKPIRTSDDDSLFALCDILNKLGKLEDIEEELGIDLVTLLGGLLNDGVVWVKLPYVPRDNGSLPDILAVDIAVQTKWSFKKPCHFMLDMGSVQFTYLLKDYGKTFALTKEELK